MRNYFVLLENLGLTVAVLFSGHIFIRNPPIFMSSQRSDDTNSISTSFMPGNGLWSSQFEKARLDQLLVDRPQTESGLIAFVLNRGNDNPDIYTMNPDGSQLRNLTKNSARDTSPTWSPDGKKLAFISNRTGYEEIYTINSDGSNLRRLTTTQPDALNFQTGERDVANYLGLSWSPDGRFLLAELRRGSGSGSNNRLAVLRADGSEARYFDGGPFTSAQWSPDGTQIVFITYNRRGVSVVTWDAESLIRAGTVKTAGIINNPAWWERLLAWSQNGISLAIIALDTFRGDYNLLVMQATGSIPRRVYTYTGGTVAIFAGPVWMPDSQSMIFSDSDKIYSINADGSNLHLLAEADSAVNHLGLSPDGSFLLISAGNERSQIYALDVTSAKTSSTPIRPVLLTRDPVSSAYLPKWQPVFH